MTVTSHSSSIRTALEMLSKTSQGLQLLMNRSMSTNRKTSQLTGGSILQVSSQNKNSVKEEVKHAKVNLSKSIGPAQFKKAMLQDASADKEDLDKKRKRF